MKGLSLQPRAAFVLCTGLVTGLVFFACGDVKSPAALETAPEAVAVGSFAPSGISKVAVCHIPPEDPNNRHVISVSEGAVAAHLAHGDNLFGEEVCDDVDNDCDGSVDEGGVCADTTPPGAPILTPVSPDPTTELSPTFDWTDVSDPSGVTYTIEVDSTSSFSSSNLMSASGLTTSSYGAFTLFPGTWYWRVRATDGAGNIGPFSVTDSFTITAE